MAEGVSCCICYEDAPLRIMCAANHATCDECFEQYLLNKVEDLSKLSGLAAEAETAASARDEGRLAALGGGCFCPLHGQGGCEAAHPFPDRDIAAHVTAEAFEKYVQGKTLLPVARKVQEVTGCPRARCPLMCRGPESVTPLHPRALAGGTEEERAELAVSRRAPVRQLRRRARDARGVHRPDDAPRAGHVGRPQGRARRPGRPAARGQLVPQVRPSPA